MVDSHRLPRELIKPQECLQCLQVVVVALRWRLLLRGGDDNRGFASARPTRRTRHHSRPMSSAFGVSTRARGSTRRSRRRGEDSIALLEVVLALCSALKEFASLSFVSNSGGVYFTMLASAVRNQLNKSLPGEAVLLTVSLAGRAQQGSSGRGCASSSGGG